MIRSVLVANRGEIACRVFRTCRELGIATVAVHSDPDASARHVREADAAVRLPGAAPADTYLRGDLVVAAALAAGADAVHPGYGFLSENADFATAVLAAGLVWIGPPPSVIEAMASKTRAKSLMAAAGVPVLDALDPGAVGAGELPVLVKASAGGGGRGMRVVRSLDVLSAAVVSARAEAAAAFGDGSVFVEPYVEGGRHVEVQVLADGAGAVWALGTRDCSLQRRHQKVIEEAPAPGLSGEVLSALKGFAVAGARAVGYVGAGTVEFLVGKDGRAFFLEMNTRLQVEHPVTELVYGVDLVALQIRVAEGAALGSAPSPSGHAVSARLYAEDPSRGWLPSSGRVFELSVGAEPGGVRRRGLRGRGPGPYIYGPGTPERERTPSLGPQIHVSAPDPCPSDPVASRSSSAAGPSPSLRVDSGFDAGDLVGTHYDSLLAKVIAWAPTRDEAVRRLSRELELALVHGPVTNRELLVRSLRHPDFLEVRFDTGFYERHLDSLVAAPDPCALRLAALAAALESAARSPSPFGGWRNVPSQPQVKRFRAEPGGEEVEIRYLPGRGGLSVEGFPGVRLVRLGVGEVVLEVQGVRHSFGVHVYGDSVVHVGPFSLVSLPRFSEPRAQVVPGSLLAPMPGTVVRVADGVAVGASVKAGEPLLWLEAMKMEHRVVAPASGTLTALHAVPGRQVEVGTLLAVVESEEHTP
ncbi:acetyl-CoA carboxylase subunit alpha [Streptomyces eurocidicus]|uniref:Acetyl-CoA carboxylase subunit alpha n=1 Tax=Streptomyces eurocidicus TaxID=66423 RepID=A0A2N8NPQ3_STREU|nr:biotin carboxylase N-terminal domain-containing protein [Streptomyces eurocidicus]MBB5119499.1 propionyl-CoA carboxylase alpha chain [Streptomyces eurocidicus]MBF6054350.1 acety-l/propionyl-CoA carboxylase subunit alpha [Streptomyces eurocidicus]PNE30744.1 acetyl-CoA carboxylase subunit alpha [Streptomyces eurocidicus]